MSECLIEKSSVTVFSLKGSGETFYPFNDVDNIVSFSGEKKPLKALIEKIDNSEYDVIFIISMGRLSVLFAIQSIGKSFLKRSKIYACEHVAISSFSLPIKFLKFAFLRLYNKVIVLTEKDATLLKSWKLKAEVIVNPVKHQNIEKKTRSHIAVAVGRLTAQKGMELLLNNWSSFIEDNPTWRLDIAGEGELEHELKQQAEKLGLIDSVNFLGKVRDMESLYRKADILLMTSIYEGLPLVLLEAKAWGVPVIAYDCPTGPREIIENGKDGFLIESGDHLGYIQKLNELANDDELYYSFSRNTKNTSMKFDADRLRENWISLID
ncbi:amylovoran biosynthesis protein AmsD [Serratia marcescens]|nr:amylovoran biosynthesis protein AmsD [Serratia marcescens]